jgi:hypothetical protein
LSISASFDASISLSGWRNISENRWANHPEGCRSMKAAVSTLISYERNEEAHYHVKRHRTEDNLHLRHDW